MTSALTELARYGYLSGNRNAALTPSPLTIIDFGAGTLGASLGALDFFARQEHALRISKLLAIDKDLAPVNWAQAEFETFLSAAGTKIDTGRSLSKITKDDLQNSIFIGVDVLNEIGLMEKPGEFDDSASWFQELLNLISEAGTESVFVFIEPANKKINQNFLRFRNALSRFSNILLPCTHACSCPALLKDEWCHEERSYRAPSPYWNLVHSLGFERSRLSYSLLCVGKKPSRFTASHARMVSRPLKSKGKCEKWFCGDGKRWKVTLLNRHSSKEPTFSEAKRGDIFESSSTGWLRPD